MKKVLAIIALSITLWACKSTDNPVTPAHVADYFPMTVGSAWTYNTWSDSAGAKVAGSDAVEIDSAVGTEEFQGKSAVKISVMTGGMQTFSYYSLDSVGNLWQFIDTTVANTGSGFWLVRSYFSNTTVGGTNTEQFPLSYTLGAYHIMLLFNATLADRGSMSVSVPAGTFSANFRADSAYADGSAYFPGAFAMRRGATYYVDGCGIVKDSTGVLVSATIINRNTATNRELVSYHIGVK